jgi:hypothetical protein
MQRVEKSDLKKLSRADESALCAPRVAGFVPGYSAELA